MRLLPCAISGRPLFGVTGGITLVVAVDIMDDVDTAGEFLKLVRRISGGASLGEPAQTRYGEFASSIDVR